MFRYVRAGLYRVIIALPGSNSVFRLGFFMVDDVALKFFFLVIKLVLAPK